MYQLTKPKINNLQQAKDNMNESMAHNINERVLMKIHCKNENEDTYF